MILSHEQRFIFLKTSKTAGTSVELALSRHCGPDDVITRLAPKDERLRMEIGGRAPQHDLAPWHSYRPRDLRRLVRRRRAKRLFRAHMPAAEVKPLVDPDVWRSYYKFCYERNPWDRTISFYYYYYQRRGEKRPSIDAFLDSDAPLLLKERGLGVYSIDGEVVADRICRFENLQSDLQEVADHLGIEGDVSLPHAKASFRADRRHYRDILTPAQRDRIGDMFSREIALMGYEF